MFTRKNIIRQCMLAVAILACSSSFAAYPDRPVSMVVPVPPGGFMDGVARIVAPVLAKNLGVSVVVVNKPGAGGAVGAGFAARAAPDGYTVLEIGITQLGVTPHLTKNIGFTLADFRGVSGLASSTQMIVVNANSRFKTIQNLMEFACANPGKLNVGTSNIGSSNWLGLIQLEEASHCQFTVIPYGGSAPVNNALLGSQVDLAAEEVAGDVPLVTSGKLRSLAVLTAQRDPALPDVPTMEEAGVKDLDVSTVLGMVVNVKTSTSEVNVLNQALRKTLNTESVKHSISLLGSNVKPSTPEEIMTLYRNTDDLTKKLIAEGVLSTQ